MYFIRLTDETKTPTPEYVASHHFCLSSLTTHQIQVWQIQDIAAESCPKYCRLCLIVRIIFYGNLNKNPSNWWGQVKRAPLKLKTFILGFPCIMRKVRCR